MNSKDLEKYSSAITLSDMEVFVFPELMYSLVLANIMSPVIWRWRREECFKKLEGKSSYRKLMRLRQYIMDRFEFNLDLETWGLTTKAKELKRFEHVISREQIAKSNALFGYAGDKYYFDVDIRKHFGLDGYDNEIIPYWKTETIEAMEAFRLKEGYRSAAGECVSLSALYAAAAFIVCGIALEDIYMVLTPLHSQNFIDLQDGVLTNNRRLVTKTMWFNGTAISNKAQRALRNENVTIVAHSTGYVHCLYEQATIDRAAYAHLANRLGSYLSAELTLAILANFLRFNRAYQEYFQVCRDCHGQSHFIKAETLFHYEHSSNYRIADSTFEKLLAEVSDEDFVRYELPGRIRCDRVDEFLQEKKPDLRNAGARAEMAAFLSPLVPESTRFVEELADFVHVTARLPGLEKDYIAVEPIKMSVDSSREEIVDYLRSIREVNAVAELAFYAYRDMESCDWAPFVKAAVERNPVCLGTAGSMSLDEAYEWLRRMDDRSIYDGGRLAQPDELVNYGTGDGLEKAFLLANIIRSRCPEETVEITVEGSDVLLAGAQKYIFSSRKNLRKRVSISGDGHIGVFES